MLISILVTGVCLSMGGSVHGMHAPPQHTRPMSGLYASYWNAFLLTMYTNPGNSIFTNVDAWKVSLNKIS